MDHGNESDSSDYAAPTTAESSWSSYYMPTTTTAEAPQLTERSFIRARSPRRGRKGKSVSTLQQLSLSKHNIPRHNLDSEVLAVDHKNN